MDNELLNVVFWNQELSALHLYEETVNSDSDENVEEDLSYNENERDEVNVSGSWWPTFIRVFAFYVIIVIKVIIALEEKRSLTSTVKHDLVPALTSCAPEQQ